MAESFWTLSRVADALAGVRPAVGAPARMGAPGDVFPRGDAPVVRVWTDTRTVSAGDLFVALRGERFDGHDFLAKAVAAGACALVVSDARLAAGLGVPVFEVVDTTRAYGALARYRREVWGGPVVAVGGSNGKTSTKELIRAALGSRLSVHATEGNLNNQIGVPHTLLALNHASDVAVIEVGTNTPGEIAILRDIVRPDIGVVTAINEEHLEGFGDLAGVLREEASLLDGVAVAIVPADDDALVAEAAKRARRAVSAGIGRGALAAESGELADDATGRLTVGGVHVAVPLRGAHNMRNAMLALAVARACGVTIEDAARGIAAIEPGAMPGMRSAVEPLGDALLVNDAYNSNPGSARAAMQLLSAVAGARPRVIVLGTMGELGAQAEIAHRDIAREAMAADPSLVVGIGEFAAAFRSVAAGDARVVTGNDIDDIWPALCARLAPNAAILLKASRSVKLERLLPRLREWASENISPYRAD
ncbi:MAG: UDP-N-acetylmuramoyl-tripeptide--D-alanyl-D-alanine ligase [Gemmatimonadetes bacterium]|nr:UDP-N-acetylmuramoyl-tripeptide--D-alanyl-D-alanine ligase [Gemmatimonadota bacterium]